MFYYPRFVRQIAVTQGELIQGADQNGFVRTRVTPSMLGQVREPTCR